MATPVRMAAVGFVLNLALSLILMRRLDTLGLALASNCAIVLQTVLLQILMSRHRPGFGFVPLLPIVLRQLLAGGVMALVLWACRRALEMHLSPLAGDLLAILLLIPIGAGVYGAVLWTIGRDERKVLAAFLQRLRTGRGHRRPPSAGRGD
jgi:peptidoglycan biosynthesis protein MviN/MurJ (putative lipid II flippase)